MQGIRSVHHIHRVYNAHHAPAGAGVVSTIRAAPV
jgi:hypothetical protein